MAEEEQEQDYQKKYIKIVLVGQSGVGKSNIISRYVQNTFTIGSNVTIGLEFSQKSLLIHDKHIVLQIWDTAGQQKFRALNKTFYKNSLGALVIFDLSNRESFDNLSRWIEELRQNTAEQSVILMVGNKSDIKDQKVSVSQALELAKRQKMGYLEASAALNINIKQAFELLTKKILQRVQQINPSPSPKTKPLPSKPEVLKSRILTGKDQPSKKPCC